MLKKTLKVLCVLIAAVLVCAVVLIAWLSATEYKPKAVEKAEIYDSEATGLIDKNESIKILSFNTGYAGLGEERVLYQGKGCLRLALRVAQGIARLDGRLVGHPSHGLLHGAQVPGPGFRRPSHPLLESFPVLHMYFPFCPAEITTLPQLSIKTQTFK